MRENAIAPGSGLWNPAAVDPVETFKFTCPGCGQHLEARAEEAGQIIVCPLCAKQLVVPQAPADSNSKLIITAAAAQTRRLPATPHAVPATQPVPPRSTRRVVAVLAVVVVLLAGMAALLVWRGKNRSSDPGRLTNAPVALIHEAGLWTTNFNQLELTQRELSGRLKGWDFTGNRPVWRGTKLILRQRNATPAELGIEVDLPLKGGELVSGRRFEVSGAGDYLPKPVVISWKNEAQQWQRRAFPAGYILKLEFTEVTPTRVSGRLHLCVADADQSWVAGAFRAEVKTPH